MNNKDIEILRSDKWLVWVNKPAGLLSVPGKGVDNQDCVVKRVSEKFAVGEGCCWAREVHRLDMDTSGIMLVALDAEVHREMMRQFRDKEVIKEYEAVVAGIVEADNGEINLKMRADIENRPHQILDNSEFGKDAVTIFEVRERYEANFRTRLRLKPMTGRTHQLRVHMAAMGHAIIGDVLYFSGDIGSGENCNSSRLLLHAAYLEILHPVGGERVVVESLCPF